MIRVAILGAGIGAQHLAAYRELQTVFKVALVVDQDVVRARNLQIVDDEFTVSPDIKDALGANDIDLIDICLPPHLHAGTTISALKAGKDVICEKPLATSLKDAHAIQSCVSETGKSVFPVFQYRWGTPLAQLKHLIDAGIAGQPQIASLETHWSRDAEYYAVPWRGTWAGEQGGAVLGHAIHSHDLLQLFMGPVASVGAHLTTRINDIETEDCAAVTFEMQNGALATSNITLGAAGNETRLRFVFENLTATSGLSPYSPGSESWSLKARVPNTQSTIDAELRQCPAQHVGFRGFLKSVAQDIIHASGCSVSVNDGVASIELVSAIYAATRSGKRVTLPLGRDHMLYKGWQP